MEVLRHCKFAPPPFPPEVQNVRPHLHQFAPKLLIRFLTVKNIFFFVEIKMHFFLLLSQSKKKNC